MKNFIQSKAGKTVYFILGMGVIVLVMYYVFYNSKIAASINSPKIVFEEIKHDFGNVPQGPQLQYNFRFRNTGGATLKIDNVTTSCGCTAASSGEKKEFAKGESGDITVTYNTQGREGHQEKTIMVFTNDNTEPNRVLTITCNIDPSLQIK
jgi:hypothetical protein